MIEKYNFLKINFTEIAKELNLIASPEIAKTLRGFFKTNCGQYSENQIFIGIKTGKLHQIAKEILKINKNHDNILENHKEIISNLISSNIHEHKLLAVLLLVAIAEKSTSITELAKVANFYLLPTILNNINNWNLVDLSCYKIIGKYLYLEQSKIEIIYKLAKSNNFWHRRIAIVSTLYFVKNNNFKYSLEIIKIIINDKEPLINKACGWVLREIGKRSTAELENFINVNIGKIKPITLSYACEKMPIPIKKYYQKLNKIKRVIVD